MHVNAHATAVNLACSKLNKADGLRRNTACFRSFIQGEQGLHDLGQHYRWILHSCFHGLALLVVLETLFPHERLAFVLHDLFAVPFEEIASIVGCSSVAARQLASRTRRRVRGAAPIPDVTLTQPRKVVDAFLAGLRGGDFEGLLAVLDPDVVLRSDHIPGELKEIRGARTVAEQALMFSRLAESVHPVLVNGAAGFVSWRPGGQLFSVMGFTIRGNRIVEIDVMRDPARLSRLDLSVLND